MFSTVSDSTVVDEDVDEEEQIYQLIYNMNTTEDKDEKEMVHIPPSSGPAPVHLEINTERDGSEDKMTYNTTQLQRQGDQEDTLNAVKSFPVDNAKGPDMETLDNIQEIQVQKAKAEEKPWRKGGADISDYFNYGFDEESWNTYCKKQSKLRAANRKQYTKIMVQKGHTRHEEKESCSAYSSSDPSIHSSRQSSATIDVIGGRPGSSGRVEGHPCLSVEGNNTQVVTEMFPEEDRITSFHLPPPCYYNSLFALTPPASFLYPRRPPSLSPHATVDSGLSNGFDGPSTSLYPCSTGMSSLIPRSMSSKTGVINTAKAWECYIWQEKCDKDRGRFREHGHDKDSKRDRERDKESCPSSHSSEEEHMRHRDTTERGHKRHSFERFSGEKEWHRERKHGDKSEGWQKSSCSSSSSSSSRNRRDSGEDRDSQSRRKHKKAKRNWKDKETNEIFSADQERKLKSD